MRLRRPTNQLHAGFIRSSAAFLVVTAEAGCDDVVPALLSARRNGHHVIEGQVFGREPLTTVLTRVIVAGIDVRARKFHAIVILYANVLQKPNNRRKFNRKRDGMNLLVVLLDDFNFSGEEQRQRFFPGYDP